MESCILCASGREKGRLACMTQKGLLSLKACAVRKGDERVSGMIVDETGKCAVHEKCRKEYMRIGVMSEVKEEPMIVFEEFCWDVDCFLCGKRLKSKDRKGSMKRVCEVSEKAEMRANLLSICNSRSDSQAVDVCRRLSSIKNLVSVHARYHQNCMSTFKVNKTIVILKDNVSVSQSVSSLNNNNSNLSQSVIPLPNLSVIGCGMARSHHGYLLNVARANNLSLVETVGGGDCFFDAVRICMENQFGVFRSISELRLAAAIELDLNSLEYAPLYIVERQLAGQQHQALTFKEFVTNTRFFSEWATCVTIAALAKSVDVIIRVVSSDTSGGAPSAFVQDFCQGVRQTSRAIVVGFNKEVAHYVALPSSTIVPSPGPTSLFPVRGSTIQVHPPFPPTFFPGPTSQVQPPCPLTAFPGPTSQVQPSCPATFFPSPTIQVQPPCPLTAFPGLTSQIQPSCPATFFPSPTIQVQPPCPLTAFPGLTSQIQPSCPPTFFPSPTIQVQPPCPPTFFPGPTIQVHQPFPPTFFPGPTIQVQPPCPLTAFPGPTIQVQPPCPPTFFPGPTIQVHPPFPPTFFPGPTSQVQPPCPPTFFPSPTIQVQPPFPPTFFPCPTSQVQPPCPLTMPMDVDVSPVQITVSSNPVTVHMPITSPLNECQTSRSDDVEMEVEQCPVVSSSYVEQCENCLRIGTTSFPLYSVSGSFTRRQMSFLTLPGTYLLCTDCQIHMGFNGKVVRSNLWKNGWPSVIAYLLHHRKYSHVSNQLWNLLPSVHRESWPSLAPTTGSTTPNEHAFHDFTAESLRYKALVTSGVIADFIACNDDFAFPSVKCPAGCMRFTDECGVLPFNHFLAWKFGISVFGGDAELLSGARTDWPMRSLQLDCFVVAPGLVVDDDKGLCVLFCSLHGAALRKPVIHVPIHPLLGHRGYQEVDSIAAAVLTPNVVRRGRMGKWTNSSHVIDCVGSYSGMSSSSICQHWSNFTIDERLASATFLAVNNREDVYRTIRQRYIDTPGGEEEFPCNMDFYDKYLKPDPAHLVNCLKGGTVVLARDAFAMQSSFFSRDSKQSASAAPGSTAAKENRSIGLLFVVVHPPNSHGHVPYDTSSAYPLDDEHVILGVLLRLLVHCPPVHGILVKNFELAGNRFLGRLLGFVKKQVCKYQRLSSTVSFLNCKAAQLAMLAEISRLNLVLKPAFCQMAADFLCALSPSDIISHEVSLSSTVDDIVPSLSHVVLLVYRVSTRASRDAVPMQLGTHHLVAGFGDSKRLVDFQFRWHSSLKFWKVKRLARTQSFESTERLFQCPMWQLLVYVSGSDTESMNAVLCRSLGGQEKMRCPDHDLFLVKQSIRCTVTCCVLDCDRHARYVCLNHGRQCGNGVCFCHARDITRGATVVDIELGMIGRRLKSGPRAQVAAAEWRSLAGSSSSSDSELDGPPEIFAPLGQEDFCVDGDAPPMHSRRDIIPIYDVTRRIPGHFLWNKGYGVLRRRVGGHSEVESSALMQHIVSCTNDACVSLLYPEGQLFPRTFWSAQNSSIAGAIPSFMLNCLSSTSDHGVASLSEHLSIRMADGDILTAKQNCYWHYVFDLILNQKLTTHSSHLVFKRGLEFLLEGSDRRAGLSESKMPMDEADSTRRIKELSCLLKKGKWDYFVTVTINESETPGVRVITKAIRQLADGDSKIERELTDAFLPFMLRAWERFTRVLFQELLLRNHTILGKVKHLFVRHEFQERGSQGNKSHCHAGVTLEEETQEATFSRISCSSNEFASRLHGTDFDNLKRLGVVKDLADFDQWRHIFSFVNTHDCLRAGGRCMKATNKEGQKVCRYHRQPDPLRSPFGTNWFETIDVPYTEEVYVLLEEMGLAKRTEDFWTLEDPLACGKWRYLSLWDEFFMASVPLLSAITRSATNVDMCDRHFQVSYLVKYVCGKEEHQLTDVSGSKSITDVKVTTEDHAHEKITGCRKLLEKKEEGHPHQGREICLAEIVWFVLGFQYTYCTASFVHVPTLPLAHRAGVLKFANCRAQVTTAQELRVEADLVDWRQFTESQQAHADEYRKSSLCIDTTSAFNIRPPELLVFDDLQLYHECFVAVRVPHPKVCCELSASPWLDCAGRTVMLHSCSVEKACRFLNSRASLGCPVASELLLEVFEPLRRGDELLEKIFVRHNPTREVVSVVSFVKPWDRTKFLTHLCLSLGRYSTELELFCSGSVRQSFVNAGLLPSASVVSRFDVLSILKSYVVLDLSFHPISARQFNRFLLAALTTLTDELMDGGVSNYVPYMSEVMLKDQATEQLAACETLRKSNLIDALYDDDALADTLPTNLRDARIDAPLQWTPLLRESPRVSRESVLEQSQALDCCVRAIGSLLDPACRGVKFPCLVGRPGSGKSHVLKIAAAYAISRGLQVELLSFTSERARKLGGNHMHLVFPLSVSRSPITVTSSIVYDCIKNLQHDPLKQAVIKRTDVFLYEEIGLLSSMMFCALDSILQFVMQNTLPFGGKLLISSGDSKQLPPISGAPIWSSIEMCTMMQVIVFKHDVRARDPNLRWLNDQCRRELDAAGRQAVADSVLAHCTIALDWSQVPDNAVRIVSTRAAEGVVMEQFLKTKATVSFQALDEVQNNTSWIAAAAHVTRRLDNALYEYSNCRLFIGALVRMTYNERHASVQFSQGQLAIVTALPDLTVPFARQRLTLRLAPPGLRQIDPANIPPHWPQASVGPRTTPALVVGRALQMGRRTQFPVRYHLTSTIHRIQGETVPLMATQISEVDRHYRLWQKEQLTVLISRAQQCADMIFVGEPSQTSSAIVSILARSSKWDAIVENYMTTLDVLCHPTVREIRMELHPYLPLYRELPTAACGYVYLLVSIADPHVCYLGETDDLKKTLREHNTGYGSDRTRQTDLQPWGVFAFICGFEYNGEELTRLRRQDFFKQMRIVLSRGPEHAYLMMKEEVEEFAERYAAPVIIVKCGELPPRVPPGLLAS